MKTQIVIFTKGISKESKVLAILLFAVALALLAIGVVIIFLDFANFGWLPALALSAIFCLMSWLSARKKI